MAKRQEHKETALVRMLNYVLGVAPHEFGLLPDEDGWVRVKDLVKALNQEDGWRFVRESLLRDAAVRVAPDDLELDEGRLRSRQRTPPRPELGADPPAHLFVGVRRRAWPVLIRHGLAADSNGPVMLADVEDLARKLGSRRDAEPVLVTVQAQAAMERGAMFSSWGEHLFLADWVPAECLMGPPVEERPAPKKPAGPKPKPQGPVLPPPESMPGSFVLNIPDGSEKPYKEKGLRKKIKWKDERRKSRRRGEQD